MKRLLLLTLALSGFSLQAAEVRYYDVEVIIFENLQANSRHAEQWPENMQREIPESLIEIGGAWPGGIPENYDPALSFTPLPADKWRLSAEAEKIEKSKSRRVLAHLAWVQPGLPQEQALSVHFNRVISANDAATESGAEQTETGHEQNADEDRNDSGVLDALIRVSLARYLRVEADLLFTLDQNQIPSEASMPPSETDMTDELETTPANPGYYHMQQVRRRIRSTELHYLDHPVLGMLIMFTPHETAEKKK